MPHITERTGDSRLDEKFFAAGILPGAKLSLFDRVAGVTYHETYADWVDTGILPEGLTWKNWFDDQAGFQALADEFFDPAPTGGGRGSSRAPYVRPDERLVKGAIEGAWAQLTGEVNAAGVATATKAFFNDDKANYDNQGQQIDPMETVLEQIRATSQYKAIHTLRKEGTDERTWISSKVGKLLSAGVSDKLAQELGVAQAQAGSAAPTVQSAGEIATLESTGRLLDSHKTKIRKSMGASLGLL